MEYFTSYMAYTLICPTQSSCSYDDNIHLEFICYLSDLNRRITEFDSSFTIWIS